MKTPFAWFSAVLMAAFYFTIAVIAADQKAALSDGDAKFLKNTAANGLTEVKLAELALQKATKSEVKDLAQMLLSDHTGVNDSLKALAEGKKVMLSAIIDPSGSSA